MSLSEWSDHARRKQNITQEAGGALHFAASVFCERGGEGYLLGSFNNGRHCVVQAKGKTINQLRQ